MIDLRSEWQHFVASKLEPLTGRLVEVLSRLVAQPYPVEVVSLDFEIFVHGFADGFPARVFFMDKNNSEYFIKRDGEWHYPGNIEPDLVDVDGIYTIDEEENFLARDGADELHDELWDLSINTFTDWFEACWRAAGGEQFPLAARIMVHDDFSSERLLSMKRMQ